MTTKLKMKKIASLLGWDTQAHLLTVAVVRKDMNLLTTTIVSMDDPKSINKEFDWRRLVTSDLKLGSPLELALRFNNLEAVPHLLNAGAKWTQDSVSMAALRVLVAPDEPRTRSFIKVCTDHHIDWNVGKFYKKDGERLQYEGTAKMILLSTLEEKAFEMGLFPKKKDKSLSPELNVISVNQPELLERIEEKYLTGSGNRLML